MIQPKDTRHLAKSHAQLISHQQLRLCTSIQKRHRGVKYVLLVINYLCQGKRLHVTLVKGKRELCTASFLIGFSVSCQTNINLKFLLSMQNTLKFHFIMHSHCFYVIFNFSLIVVTKIFTQLSEFTYIFRLVPLVLAAKERRHIANSLKFPKTCITDVIFSLKLICYSYSGKAAGKISSGTSTSFNKELNTHNNITQTTAYLKKYKYS